jgi:hypothetical protein
LDIYTTHTIHAVLSLKLALLRREKPNPTAPVDDAIRRAREDTGLRKAGGNITHSIA